VQTKNKQFNDERVIKCLKYSFLLVNVLYLPPLNDFWNVP